MYKAVILDLTGVLFQNQFLSHRFHDKFKVPIEVFTPVLKQIMPIVRKPNAPSAFSLWEPYFRKWGLNLSEEEFFEFWFSGEKPIPELIDYTKKLHESGIKVFILSNNFRERTTYYRSHFPHVFQLFDKAYFSWETGFVKPSLEALKLVLSENQLAPQDCIFFDDQDTNLELARQLGIEAEKWVDLETAKQVIEKVTA
jgi:HAD superfamily hydrolase (TIGR01509 family)